MTFVVQDQWIAARGRSTAAVVGRPAAEEESAPPRRLPTTPSALLATALVHGLIALALLSHYFTASPPAEDRRGSQSHLSIFDLGQAAEPPAASPPTPAPANDHPTPMVVTEASTAPPVREWQSTPVAVPQATTPPSTTISAATAPNASPAAAGSGGDDPYASAVPRRRDVPLPAATTAPPRDDSDALLQAFVNLFKARHHEARGVAEVRVELGTGGTVRHVLAISGAFNGDLQAALAADLANARIDSAAVPPGSVRTFRLAF